MTIVNLNLSSCFGFHPGSQFLGLSYVLFYVWAGILVCLTMVTLVFTLFWGMCVDNQRRLDRQCIDFTQLGN